MEKMAGGGDQVERPSELPELERTDRTFRAIFGAASDAMLLLDDEGHFVEVNPAASALLGLPREELLDCVVGDFSDGPREASIAMFEHFKQAGHLRTVGNVRRPNGERRTVDLTAIANVGPRLHALVLRDITDETHAKSRVRAQFDAVPVPTYAWQRIIIDDKPDFVLVDLNEAALRYSSGKVKALVGKRVTESFPGDVVFYGDLLRCVTTQQPFQRESERISVATGTARRVLITFAAAPPDIVIAHADDVTDRRKMEETLRQATKMEAVGRLAGGVAHDFNNLLSIILSYTSLLRDEVPDDTTTADDLEQVKHAAERASELTRQLLAFSRQQVLQPRTMRIGESLRGVDKMLRRLLGEDVELRLELASDGSVEADPGQIEQVIMNLAVNARDAMPEGGTLTMSVRDIAIGEVLPAEHRPHATVPTVELCVRDTGLGMDAVTRARLFEPFFTTKPAGKGTGLGLATVYGIVQQHGGTIHVESKPGATSFHVCLPRALPLNEPMHTSSSKLRAIRGGHETLLLVEDEKALQAVLVSVLRRAGYDVLTADDGEHALLIASGAARPIDLLITDVVMPRLDGRTLSDRLTLVRPTMRTLFMSGYTDDAVVLQRVLDSNVAFLQKPITPDQLLRKVREALDG